MALTLDDILETVTRSRSQLMKHIGGLTAEQWAWKPYPECKNVRETVTHLLWVDRSALESLETGREPDFGPLIEALEKETAPLDNDALLALLAESHAKLTAYIAARWGDAPLDTEVIMWGSPGKLGTTVAYLSSEDFYHAGQIAYIRMATDPTWNYYTAIYG